MAYRRGGPDPRTDPIAAAIVPPKSRNAASAGIFQSPGQLAGGLPHDRARPQQPMANRAWKFLGISRVSYASCACRGPHSAAGQVRDRAHGVIRHGSAIRYPRFAKWTPIGPIRRATWPSPKPGIGASPTELDNLDVSRAHDPVRKSTPTNAPGSPRCADAGHGPAPEHVCGRKSAQRGAQRPYTGLRTRVQGCPWNENGPARCARARSAVGVTISSAGTRTGRVARRPSRAMPEPTVRRRAPHVRRSARPRAASTRAAACGWSPGRRPVRRRPA